MREIGEALGGGERYRQGVAAACGRRECYMAAVGKRRKTTTAAKCVGHLWQGGRRDGRGSPQLTAARTRTARRGER